MFLILISIRGPMPNLRAIAVIAMLFTSAAAYAQVMSGGPGGPKPLTPATPAAAPKAKPAPKPASKSASKAATSKQTSIASRQVTKFPKGEGHADDGQTIYAAKCAKCHSHPGETRPGRGLDRCWTTSIAFFSYVKRAMPFDKKGSLKNDEVYALMAYLLSDAGITDKNLVMDSTALAELEMPASKAALPSYCTELPLQSAAASRTN
jgi:S-disulfanyl-L-cysteine oxidoreductase SoxD